MKIRITDNLIQNLSVCISSSAITEIGYEPSGSVDLDVRYSPSESELICQHIK
jgi:hypothetical protein